MSIKRKHTHIHFAGKSASGKTDIYGVTGSHINVILGRIGWYAPWRRYVFYPFANTLFDVNCMSEIVNFLEEKTKQHKER